MHETFKDYQARMLALAAGLDPFAVLDSTPRRIGALLAGRGAGDLQWSPEPGRWSIAQIVSHLADAELVFGYRVRMILSSPGTAIQAFDQNRWCETQQADTSDAFASLSLFAAVRIANTALLRRLTPEERARSGVHAERGEESIALLLRLYAGHDRNHLAQIERLLAARDPIARPFQPASPKPVVDAALLEQLDVRAGTILAAIPVDGADRLALLTVSFADRERTIVAGIRTERPSLAAVVGRQALFAVNLQPRTIRGHLSEGMLFDIGFADGLRPAFAVPEWPVPDGVRAG
jgi:tRNA-binding protein